MKRWSIFVTRATNPNCPIVVEAETSSEAMENAERDLDTVHNIQDCIDLAVEFEIPEREKGVIGFLKNLF